MLPDKIWRTELSCIHICFYNFTTSNFTPLCLQSMINVNIMMVHCCIYHTMNFGTWVSLDAQRTLSHIQTALLVGMLLAIKKKKLSPCFRNWLHELVLIIHMEKLWFNLKGQHNGKNLGLPFCKIWTQFDSMCICRLFFSCSYYCCAVFACVCVWV